MGRNFAVRIPERQNRRKKGERGRKRKIIENKKTKKEEKMGILNKIKC